MYFDLHHDYHVMDLKQIYRMFTILHDMIKYAPNRHTYIDEINAVIKDFSVKRLDEKGVGRIFILYAPEEYTNKIETVKSILKEIDNFEYDYLPDDYITDINDSMILTYTGKFDPNCEQLISACQEKGIYILIQSRSRCDSCW